MATVTQRLTQLDAAQLRPMRWSSKAGADALRQFRVDSGLQRMQKLRRVFDAMAREERRLLALRDAEQLASRQTFSTVMAIAALLFLAVAVVTFLTIRRYTRDLHRSRSSLAVLNATLEDQVKERTADLALANEEIQRFAYIVSHDLRSPLVNVMGFTAELSAATRPLAELIDRAEAEAPQIVTEDARLAARGTYPRRSASSVPRPPRWIGSSTRS